MEILSQWDYLLFEWINQGIQNELLDSIMPWWRSKYTWIPFYIGLIIFSIFKYKLKGLYFILALSITVGVSDTISSKIIKPTFERLRPCKTPEIKDQVHLLVRCGSGFSFTSSHATNHFALVSFLLFTFCKRFKILRLPLIFWASSIAFGQVYVGVHFPSDILVGSILGLLIGYFCALLYNKQKFIKVEQFELS